MTIEIELRTDVCMGSGNCSFWAPGVFDLDDDGVVMLVDADDPPEDKVILAAQGCPVQAIIVRRDGEQVAP